MNNKMVTRKILLFMFTILFISVSSASIPTLGSVQKDNCINLLQTCSDCTFNNITSVSFPNRTTNALDNEISMTKNGTEYNFTFCNTNVTGTYFVNGHGDAASVDTIWNYDFVVTETGEALDTQQSILVLGLILVLLILSCAFLVAGFKIESVPVKLFLITLGGLFLMVTIGVSVNTIKQLMLLGSVFSGVFVGIYILILALVSAGFIALVLYLITVSVKAFKKSRGIDIDDM